MMILVTGGSGSGKSAFAEDCVVSFGKTDRIYIATMYLLMKKAGNVCSAIGRCVREKDLKQSNVIQVLIR